MSWRRSEGSLYAGKKKKTDHIERGDRTLRTKCEESHPVGIITIRIILWDCYTGKGRTYLPEKSDAFLRGSRGLIRGGVRRGERFRHLSSGKSSPLYL